MEDPAPSLPALHPCSSHNPAPQQGTDAARSPDPPQTSWNNIYSAFCKYPPGEWSPVHRGCDIVTVTRALRLIHNFCSLFLNFSS
ncbi:hypothetical protein PBY51_018593 [Eleginops maclovinus]|uniref:Uncharacterized protein n=1 Tax=Eleginops maclovinus TaxID=56733 RepID=A0AAN7Y9Y1_ELEMC|nr:hypothetical protein PBY51_018593 [Eleginops maclovinus]